MEILHDYLEILNDYFSKLAHYLKILNDYLNYEFSCKPNAESLLFAEAQPRMHKKLVFMKAMTKQQLADSAGVTTKTLMNWCKSFQKELEAMGMQNKMKVLPPHIVQFIAEKLCIDVEE